MHQPKAYFAVATLTLTPLLIFLTILNYFNDLSRHLKLAAVTTFSIFYIYLLTTYTLPFLRSPLRHLPHSPNTRFLLGNTLDRLSSPPGWRFHHFTRTIPNSGLICLRGLLHRSDILLVTTPAVAKQVLVDHAYCYEKTAVTRQFLRRFLGEGLVTVEGTHHKTLRKAVAPAFAGKHIRALTPLMWAKSLEFVNVIASQRSSSNVVELSAIASHATLDIIGVACLGRDFASLSHADDELAVLYQAIFDPDNKAIQLYFGVTLLLGGRLTRLLPWSMNALVLDAETRLRRICGTLLEEGRARAAAREVARREGEKEKEEDVDILSVLLRSKTPLDDAALVSQLLTFLAAGHETTSSQITWTCYLLAAYPAVQERLRAEVMQHLTNSGSQTLQPTADTFASLPFLDAVISESLRLYPTVPNSVRIATTPTSLQTADGAVFPVAVGTQIVLPIWAIQRDEKLWGEDAEVFRPERWLEEGDANRNPYALLAFLGGPRSCIGQVSCEL